MQFYDCLFGFGKQNCLMTLTPKFQFYIMSHWFILILTHFLLGFWCSSHLPFSGPGRQSQDPLIGTNSITLFYCYFFI